MKFDGITLRFDEEQLKRFEAAAASIPDGLLGKQPVDSATIEVPIGKGDLRTIFSTILAPDLDGIALSRRQGTTLWLLLRTLTEQHTVLASGKDIVNRTDAIRWLLDQIADQMKKKTP